MGYQIYTYRQNVRDVLVFQQYLTVAVSVQKSLYTTNRKRRIV